MISITLYYEQLEHTIVQVLHRAGANVNDRDLRYLVQMDENTSDRQLIRRLIRTGLAKVKTFLRDHLADKTLTGNDLLREDEMSWTFGLDLDGDGQALADLLHWFIVWRALAGICPAFGLSALAEQAKGEALEAEDLINEELVALSMPIKVRRTLADNTIYTPNITLEDDD